MRLLFLLLLLPLLTNSRGLPQSTTLPITASFREAYEYVRGFEGNYVNIRLDRGGETYGGITRKYNPEWYGWRYVDKYPNIRHTFVPEAEFWVMDYYLTIWVKEGFYKIKNQQVANYLFDMRIHLSKYRAIDMLGKLGVDVDDESEWVPDDRWEWDGGQWVKISINNIDLTKLSEIRKRYYLRIVERSPHQKIFIKGWLKRITT